MSGWSRSGPNINVAVMPQINVGVALNIAVLSKDLVQTNTIIQGNLGQIGQGGG
jgi:hypothetical protein